jgi:hypothetical protein
VCSISVEIPLEQAQAFIHAFGLPQPGSEQWVALARLQTPAKEETPPEDFSEAAVAISRGEHYTQLRNRRFEDLPLPQQAALACQDMEFREFLRTYDKIRDDEDAATYVRKFCGVQSRAEILKGTGPGLAWGNLYNRFLLWKSAKAA